MFYDDLFDKNCTDASGYKMYLRNSHVCVSNFSLKADKIMWL